MRSLAYYLALVAVLSLIVGSTIVRGESHPLVVVTVSSLKEDVEQLLCGSGSVYVLVPPGVDPHEYQLSVSDVEVLKRADLVVSTGHTHFELKIHEMRERGEIQGNVVDVLEIPGILLLLNPVSGQPNYHMVVRDPVNYIAFILNVTSALVEVDPERAQCYRENALKVLERVIVDIMPYRGSRRGLVVVDKPHAQYAVTWLGYNVTWIVRFEEEAPLTPESTRRVSELLDSGAISAVFVTDPPVAQESRFLLEEASRNNVPVIRVPSPTSTSALEALRTVVNQVKELTPPRAEKPPEASPVLSEYSAVVSGVVGFAVGVLSMYVVTKLARRRP